MEIDIKDLESLKKAIISSIQNVERVYDKAYTYHQEKGSNMDWWFHVGHDLAQTKNAVSYFIENMKKTGKIL